MRTKRVDYPWRAFLFLIIAAFPFRVASAPDDAFARALGERMPGLLAKYGVPGAVVSCISNGDVAWTKAYGRANLKTGAPMGPDMVFNHGSDGKTFTVWGIMRLVEEGKVDLDAPANRYLKRWQVRSTEFDPAGVTVRRLLNHTAGLTVHGFLDYDLRRPLPTLVEMLEGKNQMELFGEVNGRVVIKWQPGSKSVYSGGGYVLLQMIIEDVTGEPFAEFMEREVTAPLGLHVEWVWTHELEQNAPMPYGEMQEAVGYRQLGSEAIGSEICTVADFARFVAATVPGPTGEPVGRSVLKPETVATILRRPPTGLGFAVTLSNLQHEGLPPAVRADKTISHFGANPGWYAYYILDVTQRKGFVVAVDSMLGEPLEVAVQRVWFNAVLGADKMADPTPDAAMSVGINEKAVRIVIAVWLLLIAVAGRCLFQIRRGRRVASRLARRRGLLMLSPPITALLAWWYLFYAPESLPLPLPTTFLSIWRLPFINYITALLIGWLGVAILFAICPRTPKIRKPDAVIATPQGAV